MQANFFDEEEMQKLLEQIDTTKITESLESNETEEMKAAEKRYEEYILKHKNENE